MELKPCPFCGEEAVLEEHPNFPGEFRVKCTNIYHCAIKQDQWDFKEGAIKAWNKRNIERSSEEVI